MGEHKRKDGKEVFDIIENIGNALGYLVKRENPMQKKKGSQAIDICWFLDDFSEYPIMIFEIESKAQNSIYNNAGKVFAKTNQEFLKPLFFYHIIVSSLNDTEKINDLMNLYGSYNYRLYELNKEDQKSRLIIDILLQHRRIKNKYNVYWLLKCINDDTKFWGQDSIDNAIDVIEKTISFEESKSLLPFYIQLSGEYIEFRKHIYKILKYRDEHNSFNSINEEYNSWFGSEWSEIIYYALLCFYEKEEKKQIYYFNKVKSLLEYSSYRFYFKFGDSQEYNDSLIGFSGTIIAILFCLTREVDEAKDYLYNKINQTIEECKIYFTYDMITYNCIWLLYITCDKNDIIFDKTRNYINESGGIHKDLLYDTPSAFGAEDLEFMEEASDRVIIPEKNYFWDNKNEISKEINIEHVVFKLLTDEEYLYKCSNDLIYCIKQNC